MSIDLEDRSYENEDLREHEKEKRHCLREEHLILDICA